MNNTKTWDNWNKAGGPKYPHEKVVQFLFRTFPPDERAGKTVLDFGCGSGVHLELLASENFVAIGRDFSPIAIDNARNRLHSLGLTADIALGSIASLDAIPQSSCDAIICIGVIDSAGPDAFKTVLEKFIDILKPGCTALLIFASDKDFRVLRTNPLSLYGYSDDELKKYINQFINRTEYIWMDRYITTYNNRKYKQSDHVITVKKRSHG